MRAYVPVNQTWFIFLLQYSSFFPSCYAPAYCCTYFIVADCYIVESNWLFHKYRYEYAFMKMYRKMYLFFFQYFANNCLIWKWEATIMWINFDFRQKLYYRISTDMCKNESNLGNVKILSEKIKYSINKCPNTGRYLFYYFCILE